MRRKNNKYLMLLALLLLVTVGYALISTTLKIKGDAIVKKQTWDVYWANPEVSSGSVSSALPDITEDQGDPVNTKVVWTVDLALPGDYYEFTVDAVNNGSIDAMITAIEPTVTPALPTNPEYIKYSVTYVDGVEPAVNHLLAKNTTEKYKVRVYYDETVATRDTINNMTGDTTYTFNLGVTYGQATSDAKLYQVYSPGDVVYYDPVSDSLCNSETFDITKINNNESTCYKWRVLSVRDNKFNDKITIQMDHNIVNKTTWCASSDCVYPGDALTALETATSGWKDELKLNYSYDTSGALTTAGDVPTYTYGELSCVNGTCTVLGNTITSNLKARLITGEEIRELTMYAGAAPGSNADLWRLGNYREYYFSHTRHEIGSKNTLGTGNTILSWLIENTTSSVDTGATANAYGSNNYGYWLITPLYRSVSDKSNYPDMIMCDGDLRGTSKYESGWGGVRPVLDIDKTKLN